MNVYVTGTGIVSAIGMNAVENFHSLQTLKTGIAKVKLLPDSQEILGGQVKCSDEEFFKKFNIAKQPHSRTSLLGIAAATEAWGSNQLRKDIRTGIISATSVGGMDKTELYYRQVLRNENADYNLVVTHDSGNTTEKIAAHFGISGYINTISTACSSAANAIMLGARLIQQNKLDRVIVGGTDALTDFTIKGFQSLMIFDTEWCKPFDENRNGLNLGEAAAFLVIESEESMRKSGSKAKCLVKGWHNAADAYHQTASSPEGKGATLAMKHAIEKAGIELNDITYVNAHGTGTKNNDLSESVALKNIFGANVPAFSSTKAFTGHTMAAAGAIEAVFSIMAIEHSVLLPGLNYTTPIAETGLVPQTTFQKVDTVNAVLSNSFGFGGNNSSLIFKKL